MAQCPKCDGTYNGSELCSDCESQIPSVTLTAKRYDQDNFVLIVDHTPWCLAFNEFFREFDNTALFEAMKKGDEFKLRITLDET